MNGRSPFLRSTFTTLLASACGAPSLVAQPAVTASAAVEAGGSSLRFEGSSRTSALTVAPSLDLSHSSGTLSLVGMASRLESGEWSTQGELGLSVFSPALWLLRGELAGNAGGSRFEGAASTWEYQAVGRLHLLADRAGAWIGAGGGRSWDSFEERGLIVGEAGGWMRVGPLTMFVTATPVRVADSLRYADVEGAVRWGWRAIELSATAGSRSTSESALVPSAEWLTVAGTAWLSRRLAVTTAVGRYPTDYARGYPGGRYISAAVRLSTRPRAIAADERGVVSVRPRTLPPETDQPEPVRPAFEMHRGAGDSRTLRVRVERATTVEMTGDFTDWRAVSMRAEGDGWWTATVPIPSGIHQINVRTDGGAWSVPPGLTSAADEFGGRVGLLLVP